MKTVLVLILALFHLTTVGAQIEIKATIFDKNTNETLPYANVFNQQQLFGTATNLEGYFELPNNQIGDTIVISYLGYKEEKIVVGSTTIKTIRLSPSSSRLKDVVVRANSDYLYDLVSKIRNHRRTKIKKAKTYFYLETYLNKDKAEVIEAYYNGNYSNYSIDELDYKKGRIGVKTIRNRHFTSTESSRLFSIHNLFSKSNFFPSNPLSINKKMLLKNYSLKLNYAYQEKEAQIYVISFDPKDNRSDFFSGTIWVDVDKNQLLKINLKVRNASLHPFSIIGRNDIEQVDMAITKYYQSIEGKQYMDKIHFNYGLTYSDRSENKISVNSKAFIKAYDYNNQFVLPYFKFTKHYHEDYRNLTASSYDSVFWSKNTEFRFYDRMKMIETFIKENLFKNKRVFPQNASSSYQPHLQFPYLQWSKERVKMGQASKRRINYSKENNFEVDRYNFNTKLYFDINSIQDSLIFQLVAILDPLQSFYYFQMEKEDHAFVNMYFDLLEIQKRKLEMELLQLTNPTINLMTELYEKHLGLYAETCKLFVAETDRGYNAEKMKKWNDYIFKSLNVNNYAFFKLKK
ncbi:carboxypeptidase-like regulatory domain-containing protein [Aureispira anguillae]|nr:carboxypeptidase-like regulatory domain-containing protein [Aureispira anguillae]